MSLSVYDAPTGAYTSRIPPGVAAVRSVVRQAFGITRAEVVRDRDRCQQQRSEHCECGAIDFYVRGEKGRRLFEFFRDNADALGVQDVIFDRRVVGFGNPTERRYTGSHPHDDHVHVGFRRWARRDVTEQMVRDALRGEEDDMPSVEEIWDYEIRNGATDEKAPAHSVLSWAHQDANTAMNVARELGGMVAALAQKLKQHDDKPIVVDGVEVDVEEYANRTVDRIGELLSRSSGGGGG